MKQGWDLFSSVEGTARAIRHGKLSPTDVVRAALQQIERCNPRLNALISLSPTALDAAFAIERKVRAGQSVGPLAGVPVSIKDLILTRDLPTTAGSRVFGTGLTSKKDALLVRALRRAGAVVVGKAHLHEFAFGVTNENAHFGPARNPWDPDRVSGGSSGGSAVSVAAGMCLASIGTDTRGSVRIPSAFCGLVGLKPTLGTIPLEGVLPLSWTLDHAGPIVRRVRDAALLFQVLRPRGRTDYLAALSPGSRKLRLRLGVCDYYWTRLDGETKDALDEAVEAFEKHGFQLYPVSIPSIDEALEASRILAASEALAYHRKFIRDKPQAYDPAVLERLRQGETISGVQMAEALHLRRGLIESFREAFRRVDCLVGATVPSLPPRVGQGHLSINGEQEPIVENLVRMNAPQNVAGVPALALPCGFSRDGLPLSMQLIAGFNQEASLFALGHWYQQRTNWHSRQPSGWLEGA